MRTREDLFKQAVSSIYDMDEFIRTSKEPKYEWYYLIPEKEFTESSKEEAVNNYKDHIWFIKDEDDINIEDYYYLIKVFSQVTAGDDRRSKRANIIKTAKDIVEVNDDIEESLKEEKANIKVENPGLLEVPKGKKVYDLPISHFKKLIDKKGRAAIIKGINNLAVWNKNDDPKIASWAKKMKKSLEGYGEKKINESFKYEDAEEIYDFLKTVPQERLGRTFYEYNTHNIEELSYIISDEDLEKLGYKNESLKEGLLDSKTLLTDDETQSLDDLIARTIRLSSNFSDKYKEDANTRKALREFRDMLRSARNLY